MRKVFDGTLTSKEPTKSVTVVGNHDTQKGQTVETLIEGALTIHSCLVLLADRRGHSGCFAGFFKPLAHALILLRVDGYPAIFYGDLFGTKGDNAEPPSCGGQLADIILARTLFSYGE